jgi:hypothetical protein
MPPSPLTLLQVVIHAVLMQQIQTSVQADSQGKNTQVQSSLSRCQKKSNLITPSADWKFENKKWMTKGDCPFEIKLAVPLKYPGCFPLFRKVKKLYFWVVPPPLLAAKDYSWIPNLHWGFVLHPEFLLPLSGCHDLWSWKLTKLLTALVGNLRCKLLLWLPSVSSFPDDGCFDEQLQH